MNVVRANKKVVQLIPSSNIAAKLKASRELLAAQLKLDHNKYLLAALHSQLENRSREVLAALLSNLGVNPNRVVLAAQLSHKHNHNYLKLFKT